MPPPSLTILGLGTAVPSHAVTQSEAASLGATLVGATERRARLVKAMFQRAQVATRYTCLPPGALRELVERSGPGGPGTAERMRLYDEHAAPLAEVAARRALDHAGAEAASITHLVTVSCTGFRAPGVDIAMITSLGLPSDTQRVNVGYMGCHAAINGLRVARGLAAADPRSRVLICAVELCSLHVRTLWDEERILGNALFGDGAAAIVAAPGDVASAHGRVRSAGSRLFAGSSDAMTWAVGDHGFEMTLSSRVPELIAAQVRPWLASWLRARGLRLDDVGSWAVHPGGPRIVTAVGEALGLDADQTAISREVLADFGNMSSPTILFILQRLLQRDAPRPIVALGFGPGLMAEVALID